VRKITGKGKERNIKDEWKGKIGERREMWGSRKMKEKKVDELKRDMRQKGKGKMREEEDQMNGRRHVKMWQPKRK
jgi:hypothetical protein